MNFYSYDNGVLSILEWSSVGGRGEDDFRILQALAIVVCGHRAIMYIRRRPDQKTQQKWK